jgi:glycine/D-amino acid oxidase-like deaminating enzyme
VRKADIIVAGAGSGGIAAAWSAAESGADVFLIEKNPFIGGTFSSAGVSTWEASASGTGLAELIFRKVSEIPEAVDIYPNLWKEMNYDITLKLAGLDLHNKAGRNIRGRYGVIIEPDAYVNAVTELLKNTGRCEILRGCRLTGVSATAGKVNSLVIEKENGEEAELYGDYFIDSTGSATLAEMAGCELYQGAESGEMYDEDSAPGKPIPERRNGASLIFRITTDSKRFLKRPEWTLGRGKERPKVSPFYQHFANGDISINPLLTFSGEELDSFDDEPLHVEAVCRTWDIWEELKERFPQFSGYEICWIAPEVGIREGKRIVAEKMLTQNDILDGLDNHEYSDIIAVADHLLDMHGKCTVKTQLLKKPYGVSFRSLIPRGWKNLLTACRGSGFSHLAASSCRLSRTMLQLGQAAGTAAAMALEDKRPVGETEYRILRKKLEGRGIVLDKETLEKRYASAMEKSGANDALSGLPG